MLFSLMIRRCYKLLGFGILRFHTRFHFFLLKITIVPLYHWPIATIRYCFWRLENIVNGIHWSSQIRSKLKHVSVGEISVHGQPNLINQLLWCATPFPIHHTRYTITHTSYTRYTIPHTWYTIPYTSYTLHHSPYTIHATPFPIHHTCYTIPHTSYMLHHSV
jgi:hypothetical protein